ncbi:MAG: 50S ribosomal protein L25 [Patescibacteria group bacterium]
MISLLAKIREDFRSQNKKLREEGKIPGILYGSETKPIALELDAKIFNSIYQEAGESTLIELKVGESSYTVLIHDTQIDPLGGNVMHVDFFQPSLKEEMETEVPLMFIGESLAVKDLGGTLNKGFSEIMVRSLPQNLPSHIDVDISVLNTFEDVILVKDLKVLANVEIQRDSEEVIVSVSAPVEVEKELEKPIEEDIESVEKAGDNKDLGEEKEVE